MTKYGWGSAIVQGGVFGQARDRRVVHRGIEAYGQTAKGSRSSGDMVEPDSASFRRE